MLLQYFFIILLLFISYIGAQIVCCDASPDLQEDGFNLKSSLLPSRTYCGYQHSDDYFHDRTGARIDEFPWFAALLFEKVGTTAEAICGGSLITNRYVLTAAHCLTARTHTVIGVRLGEYNIKTQKDCIDFRSKLDECSDPPQDFGIEKSIPHPMYNRSFKNADIGLIRLNRSVEYTDYIRPICLPTPETKHASVDDIVTKTGWGLIIETGKRTDTKKKILTRVISNDKCRATSEQYYNIVTENHFCTEELDTNAISSCTGDGGSPVMFSVRYQWYQEGIASFGISCHRTVPEVHTKVVNYIHWILNNIEP